MQSENRIRLDEGLIRLPVALKRAVKPVKTTLNPASRQDGACISAKALLRKSLRI